MSIQESGQGRQVHKFGGSSLADPACYRRVAGLIEQQAGLHPLVVVSAAGKTTNRLLELMDLVAAGDHAAADALSALQGYQQGLIDTLLEGERRQRLSTQLTTDLQQISRLLESRLDSYQRHYVLAHGEVWSARLLAALLEERGTQAAWLDAREFLLAEEAALARVDVAVSGQRLTEQLSRLGEQTVVITGFIAADAQGRTLLLVV